MPSSFCGLGFFELVDYWFAFLLSWLGLQSPAYAQGELFTPWFILLLIYLSVLNWRIANQILGTPGSSHGCPVSVLVRFDFWPYTHFLITLKLSLSISRGKFGFMFWKHKWPFFLRLPLALRGVLLHIIYPDFSGSSCARLLSCSRQT